MPIDLTSREQSFAADLCSLLRNWLYKHQIGRPMSPEKLDDHLVDIVERYQITPQNLDQLYDRFHRTGANA